MLRYLALAACLVAAAAAIEEVDRNRPMNPNKHGIDAEAEGEAAAEFALGDPQTFAFHLKDLAEDRNSKGCNKCSSDSDCRKYCSHYPKCAPGRRSLDRNKPINRECVPANHGRR